MRDNWMNEKTVAKYPKFCTTVELILFAFSYFVYGGIWLSTYTLFTKQIEKHFQYRTWWFCSSNSQNMQPNICDLLSAN